MAKSKPPFTTSEDSFSQDEQSSYEREKLIAKDLIQKSVKKIKLTELLQQLVILLLLVTALYPLVGALNISLFWTFSGAITGIVIAIIFYLRSYAYKKINPANFAEHLNRCNPSFQESAQLILEEQKTSIARIQVERVSKILIHEFSQNRRNKYLPKNNYRKLLTFLCLAIATNLFNFYGEMLWFSNKDETKQISLPNQPEGIGKELALISSEITIVPPRYTQLPSHNQYEMNIEAAEGSKIEWKLKFNQSLSSATLSFDDPKLQVPLEFDSKNNIYLFTKPIFSTQIYKLVFVQAQPHKDAKVSVERIYSISIKKDRPPKIRIVKPKASLTEVARNNEANFELEAVVSDDYGINEVNIVASVAKGSGEAVKFRDKLFAFDSVKQLTTKTSPDRALNSYSKHWSFQQLGMEPGDEVYFSIKAIDNRMPSSLTSSSSSIIYRWLDDQESELAADGLQISFVPEYFRSQRQIIIETKELIQDQQDLSTQSFQAASIDLGHSQNDLKTKYGQYLGDEFGEGPGEHFGLADGYHGGEIDDNGHSSEAHNHDDDDHQQHNEDTQDHAQSHEEISDSGIAAATQDDISGRQALIKQFTHNHGTVEIAPLSDRDPKTWMKIAVNQMWQAEMYLMLSQPKKALPFEEKAYQYLKLARKADRIYAKRLGFKPPPVSEKNRLSGELNDLKSIVLEKESVPHGESPQELFSLAYKLLTLEKNGTENRIRPLVPSELQLIRQVKQQFLLLADDRPTLIKYVATLEKIISAKQIALIECINCIEELVMKLWSLLEPPISQPNTSPSRLKLTKPILKTFQKELRRVKRNARNYEIEASTSNQNELNESY